MVAASSFGTEGRRGGADARLAAEARLAESRRKHDEALAQKKIRMKEFVDVCKTDRRAVRDHVREMRARSLRDLRDQIQAAKGAAKLTRLTRLAEIRAVAGGALEAARASMAVERQHQAELARIEREERARRGEIRLAHERALAAEGLRSAIFGRLTPFFEREGRSVTQAPGESRAEALLRHAERHPERAHAVVEPHVHRKVEETKRAMADAERTVRAVGGDVRAGTRRPKGEPRLVPAAAAPEGVGKVVPEEAADRIAERVMAASAPAKASPTAPAPIATKRSAARGKRRGAAKRKPARKAAKPTPNASKASKPPKPPKAPKPKASAARRKGQLPRGGSGGMPLGDVLRERDEISAEKGKGARGRRGGGKKVATTKTSPPAISVPPAPAANAPKHSYAAWCDLVSLAAAKHGRRVAFGPATHNAWRTGQEAEVFVLTQPETRLARTTIVRDARDLQAPVANTNAAAAPAVPGSTPKPSSTKENEVKAPELRDTAEIAKRIRAEIEEARKTKQIPPNAKYSVRTSTYSMGSSINVRASKLPFPILNPDAFRFDGHSVSFDRDNDQSRYTPQASALVAKLEAIVKAYHWDKSDSSTDYFHSRFHYSVELDEGDEFKRIEQEKKRSAAAAHSSRGAEPKPKESLPRATPPAPRPEPERKPAAEVAPVAPTPRPSGSTRRGAPKSAEQSWPSRPANFGEALAQYVRRSQSALNAQYAHVTSTPPILSVDPGRRYIRIVRTHGSSTDVYSFVDQTNGDIRKADSWKAPAPRARGSIFDPVWKAPASDGPVVIGPAMAATSPRASAPAPTTERVAAPPSTEPTGAGFRLEAQSPSAPPGRSRRGKPVGVQQAFDLESTLFKSSRRREEKQP